MLYKYHRQSIYYPKINYNGHRFRIQTTLRYLPGYDKTNMSFIYYMYPDQGEKAVKFFQDNITSKNKKAIIAKLQAMGDTWPKGEPINVSENIFHRSAVDVYSVEGMVIHSKY